MVSDETVESIVADIVAHVDHEFLLGVVDTGYCDHIGLFGEVL